MGVSTYKKKIEAYIKDKENTKPKDAEMSKGLLAPKASMDRKTPPTEQDTVASISEFIYALRQKRMELKQKKNKEAK